MHVNRLNFDLIHGKRTQNQSGQSVNWVAKATIIKFIFVSLQEWCSLDFKYQNFG